MAPPHVNNSPQKEGRVALAMNGLHRNQFPSRNSAAQIFHVYPNMIKRRQQGIPPRKGSRAYNRLLQEYEEAELIKWICSMERRGFPPFLINVK